LHLDAANPKSYTGSGTAVTDISSNNNNSVLTNGVAYSSANRGYFVFDGTNDTIDCGPVPQIGASLTGLTVSVWLNSTTRAVKCILENGTAHTTNTFYMFQENTNYFTFEVFGDGNYDAVFANYVYQLNVWYNLVGVWSSGNRVDMYTNGVLSNGSRIGAVRNNVISGNTNMFVGARAGTSYQFAGNISDVKLYNKALSAAEIQQNFEALRGRYGI
jgi:hypothetical protein